MKQIKRNAVRLLGNALIQSLLTISVHAQSAMPLWVQKPVGSLDHPVGAGALYARCAWAGVFPESAGWSTFSTTPNLSNEKSVSELDYAIIFFNELHKNNKFYLRSANRTLSEEVVLPSIRFIENFALDVPKIIPKDLYETNSQFKIRMDKFLRDRQVVSYSFVLGSTSATGLSALPDISLSTEGLMYDADKSQFYIPSAFRFERRDRKLAWDYTLNTTKLDKEANVLFTGTLDSPRHLVVSMDPPTARLVHPYLAVVATGKLLTNHRPIEDKIELSISSLEVRNMCTNQTLNILNFSKN